MSKYNFGPTRRRRNPIYALAPIRVTSHHAPHDTTVNAILKALGL